MTQDRESLRVLDALGRAVPQAAPPSALRARVLAAAVAEAQEPVATAGQHRPTALPRWRLLAAANRWPWLLAAAATFVAVTTSLGWVSARQDVTRLRASVADLRASAAAVTNVRAAYTREQSARQRAAAILSASDVTTTVLTGVSPAAAARARVYVSATRGLFLAADALPPLADGRVYQLWSIVRGTPVSGGVFELDERGQAQVLAEAPPGPADAFAVTIEPRGGVPAPTGDKVLLGVPAN